MSEVSGTYYLNAPGPAYEGRYVCIVIAPTRTLIVTEKKIKALEEDKRSKIFSKAI